MVMKSSSGLCWHFFCIDFFVGSKFVQIPIKVAKVISPVLAPLNPIIHPNPNP